MTISAIMFVSSLILMWLAAGIATGATVKNWRNPNAWVGLAFIVFGAAMATMLTINGNNQKLTTRCLHQVLDTARVRDDALVAAWTAELVDRNMLAHALVDNPLPTC